MNWYTHNWTYGPVNDYLAERAPELNLTCDDIMAKSPVMSKNFIWKNTMKDKTEEEI